MKHKAGNRSRQPGEKGLFYQYEYSVYVRFSIDKDPVFPIICGQQVIPYVWASGWLLVNSA